MQSLLLLCLILLALVPLGVGAVPMDDANGWTLVSGKGGAAAVAHASAFGVVLCSRVFKLTHFCTKRAGHE
eukprot:9262921-Pyramimonas_sp.AAC.1